MTISERLDRLPSTRYMVWLIILLFLAWIAEAFDQGTIGPVLADIKPIWHLSTQQVGLLGISATVALVLGLIPSGYLVDRFGRKRLLWLGMLWFSIFTVLAGFSGNFSQLFVFRVIAGFAEGAIFPLPYAYLSELIHPKRRGAGVGWLTGILLASYLIPSLVSVWSIHHFGAASGWRVVFFAGGIPIIFAFAILVWLPESPRWLEQRGHFEKAVEVLHKIEHIVQTQSGSIVTKTEPVKPSPRIRQQPLSFIFKKPLRRRTAMISVAYTGTQIFFYVMMVYGPTILISDVITFAKSVLAIGTLMFCGGLGNVCHGYLSDKFGRRPLIIGYGIIAGLGCVGIALLKNPTIVLVIGVLVGLTGMGIYVIKLYIAEQFPTVVRGRGTAFTEFFGRAIGGVLIVFYMPFFIEGFGTRAVFLLLGAVLLLITVAPVLFWGRETSGESIDAQFDSQVYDSDVITTTLHGI